MSERAAYGRGNSAATRAPRAALASGVAAIETAWQPHDYQAPLLTLDQGLIVAVGALGSGKSEPGALKLLQWALRHPRRADGRPTKWYAIGQDFSLLRQEQFGKILEHARRLKLPGGASVVKRVVYGIDPRIVLLHDQVIMGRSSTDPDRLRGHEVDGFWGDEIQAWTERAFRIAISRTRSAAATRVVLTGSPEDSPGWIWHLISGEHKGYNRLRAELKRSGSGVFVFRWSSASNRANREGVLGAIRAVMDASAHGVAAQELEGRFPGTHESPLLGEIDYAPAFARREVELDPSRVVGQSMGVDVGETQDFSWVSILSPDGVLLYQDRFNVSTPGVPRSRFYPYLEDVVVKLVDRWKVETVVIDVAKAGAGVAQHLALRLAGRARVVGYDTGAGTKKADAIEILGTAMSRGDVVVSERWKAGGEKVEVRFVDVLAKELSELAPKDTGKRRTWDHPPGGHDDGPVSLALAYHGLTGPRAPSMFRREWMRRRYSITPAGLRLEGEILQGRALVRVVAVALPEEGRPDSVVLMALGAEPLARRLVVLEVDRAVMGAPEIVPRLRAIVRRWQAQAVFMRKADAATAGQLAVTWATTGMAAAVRSSGLDVREAAVPGDRVEAALPVATALQGGVVWLHDDAEWRVGLERELLEFPAGPHGNQVAALAVGVRVFNELAVAAVAPSGAPPPRNR
ncbi:MAG: hypothetical protein KIT58_07040, partial [Planctomycetota bacterium]|nr:hypothetical protein [Planctomycetota bacterium]